MLVKDVATLLEQFAPLQLQESYDNAGLCIGSPEANVTGILITIDITDAVLDEAIEKKCNLILSHHPLIFSGLKKITGQNMTERCVIKAIQHNIAIYSAHTNADAVYNGVSQMMSIKLGLLHCKILNPLKGMLQKLVTYVPSAHADEVRSALFAAGAGNIGDYDNCSFTVEGQGTFRGNEITHPYVGIRGELHTENEVRMETIFPKYFQQNIIRALLEAHPYEEVAYDIYTLENTYEKAGFGMVGELEEAVEERAFLQHVKTVFKSGIVRHTNYRNKPVQRVAVCGGSGSFLLPDAIRNGADVFISADFKYHQFFDAEGKTIIIDIGHYESEQFTKELFYDLLMKKFPNFAVHFSGINTNPINYL
jgi:dinuclear metal center YbgI/SA1388 family protein